MTTYDTALDVDSPVSHWKMGEPSGTTMTDRIGTQNGAFNGPPTFGVAGLLTNNAIQNAADTAVTFGGVGQNGLVGENAAHRPTSLTVEFWITTPASSPGDFRGVFFKSSGDSWNDGYGFTWRDPAGTRTIEFWCNNYTNAVVIPVTLSETMYIAGTFTGGTIRAYKNGAEVGTPVTGITLTHSVNQIIMSSAPTTGGGVGPSYYCPCTLDEVAIYGSALSGSAIAAHYAAAATAAVAPTLYVTRSALRLN